MSGPNSNAFDGVQPIAIIGMAGRFPGADNIETFWKNLRDGVESITFFNDDELNDYGIDSGGTEQPNYVKAKPILSDIESFDAGFFGMSPREAELTDPQHRVFLECAWEALENAAHVSGSFPGRIGMYATASKNTYLLFNLLPQKNWFSADEVFQILIGNEKDYLSSRVSYKLNLTGPSITIQSACSSSLVAVHLACQSLSVYECDMALAGGVTVDTPHKAGYLYHPGHVLSPDGHCRAFDAAANGTIFGQGAGVLALRRLEDALSDNDCIHGLILGSAVNNDGSLKVSLTAPSVEGQAQVIAEAMAYAGAHPESITYVEAHGTATPIGDPLEVEALCKAFRHQTNRGKYCALGSVKTNTGHLNAAAGIAGLIKTVLALENKQIPPSLHFSEANPRINLDDSPFFVNTELREWKSDEHPRRAGVSSFGQGGTNAHVILQEAPARKPSPESRPWHALAISALTSSARNRASKQLCDRLQESSDFLPDIAYTLHVGRRHFPYRRVVICESAESAVRALETLDPSYVWDNFKRPENPPVALILPGFQPGEYRLPKELFLTEPSFREEVARCFQILRPIMQADLLDWFARGEFQAGFKSAELTAQADLPLTAFIVQYSLAKLWMSWGIKPEIIVADGAGEFVAACLAGVLTLKDSAAILTKAFSSSESHIDLLGAIKSLKPAAPKIPIISSFTGSQLTAEEASDLKHLAHVSSRESQTGERLARLLPHDSFIALEVGTGAGGKGPSRVIIQGASMGQVRRSDNETETASENRIMTAALSSLWLAGASVDWQAFYAHEKRLRVPLPTYPFERKRYWIEPKSKVSKANANDSISEAPDRRATSQASIRDRQSIEEAETDISYVTERDEVEKLLAGIFESTLGLQRVDIYDDFFKLGGHSLLVPGLLAKIEKNFGVRIPANALFECPSVEELANLLKSDPNIKYGFKLADEGLRIGAEVILDPSIRATDYDPDLSYDLKSVFLTGATGFLGAHLLNELLKRTSAQIYCLVRASSVDDAFKRIKQNLVFHRLWRKHLFNRVVAVPGDLSEPYFGMTQTAFGEMAANISSIYHCGAQVSLFQTYKSLKKTNVGGTQEILRLAASVRTKPVHYISSVAVFESDSFAEIKEVKEDQPLALSKGFHDGYNMSKWVSESITCLARERGIPVSVYRAGNIAGHSENGITLRTHIIASLIKGCIQLGAAPGGNNLINVIPVDLASKMIVELSLQKGTLGKNFHIINPRSTRIADIIEWLRAWGYRLDEFPYEVWCQAVKDAPGDNALKPFLALIDNRPLFSNRIYDYSNTSKHLVDRPIRCPEFDEKLLHLYISYLRRTGYIPEPG